MKIQDRYFLFYMSSIVVFVVGLIGRYYFANPPNLLHTMPSGLLIILGVVLFFFNGYKMFLWSARARRFKEVFGINPPNEPQMYWKILKAIQPIVDECLKAQARDLHVAYEAENEIFEENPENLAYAMERAKKIMIQVAFLEREKKIFWSKHKLAWEWGFEVYNGYKSYIEPNSYDQKSKKQF